MVRRVASQVHKQVSRLMKGNAIKDEPAWYRAVLANPPLPLPAKAPPARSAYDQHHKDNKGRLRPYDPKPLPIYYLEDDIRRQFFRDHPFEAFRPVTLVERSVIGENREGLVSGKEWIRLRQRGRNPSPEDAVQFALNLHVHHDIPLTYAYARAVAQFRALRSEHHIASSVSLMEADFFGAVFEPSETAHTFEKEIRSLDTWRGEQRWTRVP
ncbi:hypothetical protein MPER_07683 [Moniliophthora perniciosa FA553]|nr:hypothetical protein MPER_07683 [Moniliophthora perniciosa FA553]